MVWNIFYFSIDWEPYGIIIPTVTHSYFSEGRSTTNQLRSLQMRQQLIGGLPMFIPLLIGFQPSFWWCRVSNIFLISIIYGIILPIDELICFKMFFKPPTRFSRFSRRRVFILTWHSGNQSLYQRMRSTGFMAPKTVETWLYFT